MAKTGRAVLEREIDAQYTVLIYSKADNAEDEQLESSVGNLTLANAFNGARDALAAMATGAEVHKRVTIHTKIV